MKGDWELLVIQIIMNIFDTQARNIKKTKKKKEIAEIYG